MLSPMHRKNTSYSVEHNLNLFLQSFISISEVYNPLAATFVDFIHTDGYIRVVPLHAQNAGTPEGPDCRSIFWHSQYVTFLLGPIKRRPTIIWHHMATKQQSHQKDAKWQEGLQVPLIALPPGGSAIHLMAEMWDVSNVTISAFPLLLPHTAL